MVYQLVVQLVDKLAALMVLCLEMMMAHRLVCEKVVMWDTSMADWLEIKWVQKWGLQWAFATVCTLD